MIMQYGRTLAYTKQIVLSITNTFENVSVERSVYMLITNAADNMMLSNLLGISSIETYVIYTIVGIMMAGYRAVFRKHVSVAKHAQEGSTHTIMYLKNLREYIFSKKTSFSKFGVLSHLVKTSTALPQYMKEGFTSMQKLSLKKGKVFIREREATVSDLCALSLDKDSSEKWAPQMIMSLLFKAMRLHCNNKRDSSKIQKRRIAYARKIICWGFSVISKPNSASCN